MPSTSEKVRTLVANAPAGTFIRSSDLDGTRSAVNSVLSRLRAKGELVHIRNGLYWKGVRSRFGPGRPGRLDAALALAREGAGPTGWAATNLLGLSTQMPAEPEVAVAGPAPTFAGVRFRRRSNLARRDLNVAEIALLEALRSFPAYSEVDADGLKNRVRALEDEGAVRMDVIRKVARGEHSPRLRANLDLLAA